AALQLEQREAGEGRFELRPRGVRERYAPVVYLAPDDSRWLVGPDLYADPVLRAALDASLDAGSARLRGPVVLPGDPAAGARDSLMMFAPVYGYRRPPAAPGARSAGALGWVFVPLRPEALVQFPSLPAATDLKMRITDVRAQAPIWQDDGFDEVAL